MKLYAKYLVLLFVLFSSLSYGFNGIRFIENKGQWVQPFLYKANLGNGALFVERNSFTYNFYNSDTYHFHNFNLNTPPEKLKYHAFRINFLGANNNVIVDGKNEFSEYYNYFLGKDAKKWQSNVKACQLIHYNNIYDNVDLNLYSLGDKLKYDVIINPGGKTDDVQLSYEGTDKLRIDKSGYLHIVTSVNEIIEQKPYAYQKINGQKIEVPCKFILTKNILSFKILKNYNSKYPLVIDPVLVFASYSGSYADNFGMTATYGYDGSLFAGGTAFDIGYPTTLGAIDTSFNGTPAYGITDVVITRYDSTGANLIYSTYIGGVEAETVHSLIADENNNLYIYGATSSTDFPVTTNAYDTTFNGGSYLFFSSNGTKFNNGTDIYIAKLNPTGTALLGSTYMGGSANDGVNHTVNQTYDTLMNNYGDQYRGEIMLDSDGNCYIASSTKSADFPYLNGLDSTLNGHQDAVVFKLNPDLSSLFWSTYLGGSNADAGFSLKVDTNRYVYVCGGTNSIDFPSTAGSIQSTFQGGKADGYIAKIDSNGSSILVATYIGTNDYDQCYFVEIDRFGSIYTVGQTRGSFPIYNANYSDTGSGQFIMRMNNSLSLVDYSTLFGNGNVNAQFSPAAFLVDRCENVYVSGWGGNILTLVPLTGMPTTPNATQPTSGDGYNFYLFVLERDAQSMLFGTYFGGNLSHEHVDGGTSRFDKNGIVYQSVCAGCWNNDDFPTTNGAWSNGNNSTGCNNGIFKFDFEILPKAQFTVDNYQGCAPLTVTFTNTSTSSDTYLWDFGGGDTTSQVFNPVKTYSTPGIYYVSLLIEDSICNTVDTAFQTITVSPSITISGGDTVNICNNTTTLSVSTTGGPTSFIWSSNNQFTDTLNSNPLDSNYFVTLTDTNWFYVMATNGSCFATDSFLVNYNEYEIQLLDETICLGETDTLILNNLSNYPLSYSWTPVSSIISGANTANPIVNPTSTTNYVVSTQNDAGCIVTDSLTITVFPQITISGGTTITTCDTATLSISTTGGPTSIIWSSNNQFTDTLNSNPLDSNYFVTVSDTSWFYVMATNGSCPAIDSFLVNYVGFEIMVSDGSICQGDIDTLNLINLSTQNLSYSWTPVSSIISGANTANPIVNPNTTTSYIVTTQNSIGCTIIDSVTITVFPQISISGGTTITTCDTATLSISTTGGPTSIIWSSNNQFTDTLNSNPLDSNYFLTVSDTSWFYVMATNGSCPAIDSFLVNYVGFEIQAVGGAICQGNSDTLNVINLSEQTLTYNWNPVYGIISGANTANPIVNPNTTTSYTVTAQNTTGCIDSATTLVAVSGFNPDNINVWADQDTLYSGEGTYLHVTPNSGFSYIWLPPVALSSIYISDPYANPLTTITYSVQLTEIGTGCEYTKSYTLYAFEVNCGEPDVFIPNAFTPNGDKENDVLLVRGRIVEDMVLKIYDRWGELVFETDKQSKGWDGTYKGKPVDPGVFVYYLTVTCVDQQKYFKKGNVTVIR